MINDLIVAVDFDGTIVEHEFPKIGPIMPGAKETLKWMRRLGIKIIIWTCRDGKSLDEMIRWLTSEGIPFDAVNNNLPGLGFETSRKIYADWYIDDRGLPGLRFPAGWPQVQEIITDQLKRMYQRMYQ